MAKGDVQLSPYLVEFIDYQQLKVTVVVAFNDTTRALQSALVHRDAGCKFVRLVLDNPGDAVNAKRLALPADGQGDRTYTAAQLASQGLNTYEDFAGVQITCE